MNWFLIALIAPALWSISNHLDKYLLGKYFHGGGIGALMIFSSLIGFFIAPIIYVFFPEVINIDWNFGLLVMANGFLYVLGFLPYFYALQKDEASVVVPLFQTIPVFSYILGLIFLNEVLAVKQILASLLIIGGAFWLSMDLNNGKIKLKQDVFWLMFLTSFFVALNGLIFKYVAIRSDFWTTSFWEYLGMAMLAIVLYSFVPSYRKQFRYIMQTNKVPVLGLNGFNEVVNIVAKFCMNFATLLAPLALVWVVNGFQPFFVFVYGIFLTVFFPKLGEENITRKILVQKLTAIVVMFLGTILINN